MLVERDRRDAVRHRSEGGDGRRHLVAAAAAASRAGAAPASAPATVPPQRWRTIAAGERHGGYGTLVRSWVAAPPGSWSQPFSSWPAPRRRSAASFPPTSASAASPPTASPSTSTRGWRRWRGGRPPSPPRSCERHEARYGVHVGRVNLVLADVEDDPNGFATPLPYPLVHVRAVAPDGSEDFGNYDDWLRLVLTHELTHIVHLDEARGRDPLRRARSSAARPSCSPTPSTPTWMIEGLATYEETQGTAFGRGRNPDARMVLRMAAARGRLPQRGSPGGRPGPAGRAGRRSYLFGEAFLRRPLRRSGAGGAARARPRPLRPRAPVPRRVHRPQGHRLHLLTPCGRSGGPPRGPPSSARPRRYAPAASRVSRALTTRGVRQSGPRFSPDGHWIAFTDRDLTHFRSIRLVGRDGRRRARRSSSATAGRRWPGRRTATPSSTTSPRPSASSACGRTCALFDLATRRARWITRGLRARDPDVSRDGRTVVFVREHGDRSDLALVSLDGTRARATSPAPSRARSGAHRGGARPATPSSPSRFLPGGSARHRARRSRVGRGHAAHARTAPGRRAGLDAGRRPRGLPLRPRRRLEPLLAARGGRRALSRVTNVLGGAFTPDVSPDGRALAFAELQRARLRRPRDAVRSGGARCRPSPSSIPTRPSPRSLRPRARPGSALSPGVAAPPALLDALLRPHLAGDEVSERSARAPTPSSATPGPRRCATAPGTDRLGGRLFYQYDRFRPTLAVSVEDKSDPASAGFTRSREVIARATLPAAAHAPRRAERQPRPTGGGGRRSRTRTSPTASTSGGLEVAWTMSTARQFPYSISPGRGLSAAHGLRQGGPGPRQRRLAGQGDRRTRASIRDCSATTTRSPLHLAGGVTVGQPRLHALVRGGRIPGRRAVRRGGHQPGRPARLSRRRLRGPPLPRRQRRIPVPARASAARVPAAARVRAPPARHRLRGCRQRVE